MSNPSLLPTPAEWLLEMWETLADGADQRRQDYALGYLDAMHDLGLVTDLEQEAWKARFTRCPYGPGNHIGGRGWCAYCGVVNDEPTEAFFAGVEQG